MKRLFTIIALSLFVTSVTQAQEVTTEGQEKVMYLDSEGNSAISSNNGNLSIMLNGSRFEIGNGKIEHIEEASIKKPQRAYFGFMGLDSPSFNHIAWFEIGTNAFVNTDYSMYSPEDANALMFSSTKSINYSFNVCTLNVPLTQSRSFVFSMAFGFTLEDYVFNSNNTYEVLVNGKTKCTISTVLIFLESSLQVNLINFRRITHAENYLRSTLSVCYFFIRYC